MNAMKSKKYRSKELNSPNLTAAHRQLSTMFRHTRLDDGFLFDTQILEIVIEQEPVANSRKLATLLPQQREVFEAYCKGSKTVTLPMNYTTKPLNSEALVNLIGPQFNSAFCLNSWVSTYSRPHVQEWMEGYRNRPNIDLGIKFGFPDLDEGFASTLTEMGEWHPLDFEVGNETRQWNELTLQLLPPYRLPLFQVDLFSVRHWIELVSALAENHPELTDCLSSRKTAN
ncbi:MAG: hypothetical protein LCH78_15780 [Proteobacteria bacterium]|nr:hypothetical protein [Pseudomonadota bacterium]